MHSQNVTRQIAGQNVTALSSNPVELKLPQTLPSTEILYPTALNQMLVMTEEKPFYPITDITMSELFVKLHRNKLCYVIEEEEWFCFDGTKWVKDVGGLEAKEMCKIFAQKLLEYVTAYEKAEVKVNLSVSIKCLSDYTEGLQYRSWRNNLLADARSAAKKSIDEFDTDVYLFNCANGTFNLQTMKFHAHDPLDYITKISRAIYNPIASCERWAEFIREIMCHDGGMERYLQKSKGYSLSGDTSLHCMFISYGKTTRNGKSTLMESIAYLMNDYADTIQPQSLSRRPSNGAATSSDITKLKGVRYVRASEPEKGMKINSATVKQLTGGDQWSGRMLFGNPITFDPECKLNLNTNYLPQITDTTLLDSDRVKLLLFDRHFKPEERDPELKNFFRQSESMSGILNWLIEGYRLLQDEGLVMPEKAKKALNAYRANEARSDTDKIAEIVKEELRQLLRSNPKTSNDSKLYYSERGSLMGCVGGGFNGIVETAESILYLEGKHLTSCNFKGRDGKAVKMALVDEGVMIVGMHDTELLVRQRSENGNTHILTHIGSGINFYAFDIEQLFRDCEES